MICSVLKYSQLRILGAIYLENNLMVVCGVTLITEWVWHSVTSYGLFEDLEGSAS